MGDHGTGQEVTYCCFNAVLRDYARLGPLSPMTALGSNVS